LVRLITQVYDDEALEDAEKRLQDFVRDVVPVLEEYLPGKDIVQGVRDRRSGISKLRIMLNG